MLGLELDVILHIEFVEDEEHLAPLRVVVGFETKLEWDVRSIVCMMHGRSRDRGEGEGMGSIGATHEQC